jgi:hypothetical protein
MKLSPLNQLSVLPATQLIIFTGYELTPVVMSVQVSMRRAAATSVSSQSVI